MYFFHYNRKEQFLPQPDRNSVVSLALQLIPSQIPPSAVQASFHSCLARQKAERLGIYETKPKKHSFSSAVPIQRALDTQPLSKETRET